MATKTLEKRVPDLEEIIDDIPRLINRRFAHVRAQLDGRDARVGTREFKVDGIRAELRAPPRVLAEMLDSQLYRFRSQNDRRIHLRPRPHPARARQI